MIRLDNIIKKIFRDSIFKNSMYLISTNFFNMALGFFFWAIATRHYTTGDIGITSAILSSIYLVSTISLIGMPLAMTFYLPMYYKNSNGIINSCLIIGILISIIFSLMYILAVGILAPGLKVIFADLEMIIIFVFTTMMMTVSSLMTGAFTAGKKSSYHMVKENISSIIKIFMLIILTGFGVIGIILSWSISLALAIMVGFYLLFKLWKYVPALTFDPIIKNMAKFAIGNHIAWTFYNVPRFVFPIIILDLISAESAGYFFIAMTVAGLLYGIPYSISLSFLAESSDKDNFWKNVNKILRFNMYILIPGLLLFMILGKFILNFFNPNYADNSFTSFIILSMTSFPISLIVIFNMIESAQKRVMTIIKINVMVVLMSIIFSIPLMKIWGIEGVAMAYFIANTIIAIVITFKVKNPIEFATRLYRQMV